MKLALNRTKHKAVLVKEQCRLDMRKYSFSQRKKRKWNKFSTDYVNASNVNTLKKLHTSDMDGLHINEIFFELNGFLVHLTSGTYHFVGDNLVKSVRYSRFMPDGYL